MGISRAGIRTARAAVFTALCVPLSAGTHVLFSGTPLPVLTVTAVSLTVFALAFSLAGKERRFWHIAALLLPLQLGADAVFTTGQAACYGPGGGPNGGVLRFVGVELLCAGGELGTPLARLAGRAEPAAQPAGPWLLLAAHVAVGLAACGWLRCGEAGIARLLRAAVTGTFRPVLLSVASQVTVPDALSPTPPVVYRPGGPRVPPLLTHSVLRRGPPCPGPTG